VDGMRDQLAKRKKAKEARGAKNIKTARIGLTTQLVSGVLFMTK